MKKTLFTLSVLLLFVTCYSQTLQVGVYSNLILKQDKTMGGPSGLNIYMVRSLIGTYATGINLYLKIDSITGVTDSVKVNRTPDYVNVFLRAPDSILLDGNTNYAEFDMTAAITIYTSLKATGTPTIAGEKYTCIVSTANYVANNVKSVTYSQYDSCWVLPSIGIYENKNNPFSLSPNPTTGSFTLSFREPMRDGVVRVFNVLGEEAPLNPPKWGERKAVVDVSKLPSGIYFVQVSVGERYYCQKVAIE